VDLTTVSHGRVCEIEREPVLRAAQAGPGRQVGEENKIERERRRQDRVAAEEIDLDLHRLAEPADEIDVVPGLFVVPAWRVVIDAHAVDQIAVQVRV